jgi:hypothetical protein
VLDGINTEFIDQSYARTQALKAIEHMRIDESIAILTLTQDLKLQNFTRNRPLLLAAIDAFHPNLPPYPMRQRIQVTLAALKAAGSRHTTARSSAPSTHSTT